MASSQVNKKNKRDTLRDMFDDSHADGNPDDSAMDTRDDPDDPPLDPTSDAATSDAVHAADLDGGDFSDLDDSFKDPDFDPSKEKEKEEDEDDDVKVALGWALICGCIGHRDGVTTIGHYLRFLFSTFFFRSFSGSCLWKCLFQPSIF